MNIAFLGLGAIGRPMAVHLSRPPFSLAVWNRTASRAADFAGETGARHATTPADAAHGSAIVITCLPTSQDVEQLLDGADGLLAGMQEGALLLDCTSGDPATSRRLAARLAERGIGFLDAPVSGGVNGAIAGKLTVMIGGEAALLERARPLLDAFAARIVHCGQVGAGDAVKAVNNALLAVSMWATGEGLAALTSAGVDPGVALEVINASSGRSNASENLFPQRVLNGAFPRTFRLALLDKDVGIAAGVAREQRVPAPLLQLASELVRIAHHELGEDADHVEAVRLIEKWADVKVRGPASDA